MAMSGNLPPEMMQTLQGGEEGGLEQRVSVLADPDPKSCRQVKTQPLGFCHALTPS